MVLECAYRSRRILELCGAAMWKLVRRGAEDNGIVHGRSAHQGRAAGEIMMTTISSAGTVSGAGAGFLDKERTIATAGFNRWLVPPAALCIHLCIGMAYGFSVFWLPLSRAIGITKPIDCPADADGFLGALVGLAHRLFVTNCDWKVADLGWMY